MRSIKSLILVACLFMLPSVAGAAVWTVGPGGDFAEVQDAVDAAVDGDTILIIASGDYDGFAIDGKELYVAGDQGLNITVEQVVVKNLLSNQVVVISNLKISDPANTAFTISNSQGPVRIEDCSVTGAGGTPSAPDGMDALYSNLNSDLAFTNCNIRGGDGATPDDPWDAGDGGRGILSAYTVVTFYDCQIYGGRGGDGEDMDDGSAGEQGGNGSEAGGSMLRGGRGGHGIEVNGGSLFASGSSFTGGSGGDGGDFWGSGAGGDGGDGGHGIYLTTSDAIARLLDNTYQGGKGGFGGIGVYGNGSNGRDGVGLATEPGAQVLYFDGTAHSLEMPWLARENEQITLSFHGEPGDHAALLVSMHTGWEYVPDMRGVLLMSLWPPPIFLYLGILPPSGTLGIAGILPDQGSAFEAITMYLQSIFDDGAGKTTLGSNRSFMLLDKQY